ncbi:hypothetical protein V7139_27600, partial [Neobacillus drentensis]
MRRSLKTNSLVLISDTESDLYPTSWQAEDGAWHHAGMGKSDEQSLDYMQNKTLLNSNQTGIHLYLFFKDKEYHFIDRVLLADEPYKMPYPHNGEDARIIYMFKLIEIGKSEDLSSFLYRFTIEDLTNRGILTPSDRSFADSAYYNILSLMKENNIETLVGPNNWFLSHTGYFYNPESETTYVCNDESQKTKIAQVGNIEQLIQEGVAHKVIFENQDKLLTPYFKHSLLLPKALGNPNLELNETQGGNLRVLKLSYNEKDGNVQEILFDNEHKRGQYSMPFTSLLIGPNGTGKSTFLSLVQKIFLDQYTLIDSKHERVVPGSVEQYS